VVRKVSLSTMVRLLFRLALASFMRVVVPSFQGLYG
jgi:hypothetical protein